MGNSDKDNKETRRGSTNNNDAGGGEEEDHRDSNKESFFHPLHQQRLETSLASRGSDAAALSSNNNSNKNVPAALVMRQQQQEHERDRQERRQQQQLESSPTAPVASASFSLQHQQYYHREQQQQQPPYSGAATATSAGGTAGTVAGLGLLSPPRRPAAGAFSMGMPPQHHQNHNPRLLEDASAMDFLGSNSRLGLLLPQVFLGRGGGAGVPGAPPSTAASSSIGGRSSHQHLGGSNLIIEAVAQFLSSRQFPGALAGLRDASLSSSSSSDVVLPHSSHHQHLASSQVAQLLQHQQQEQQETLSSAFVASLDPGAAAAMLSSRFLAGGAQHDPATNVAGLLEFETSVGVGRTTSTNISPYLLSQQAHQQRLPPSQLFHPSTRSQHQERELMLLNEAPRRVFSAQQPVLPFSLLGIDGSSSEQLIRARLAAATGNALPAGHGGGALTAGTANLLIPDNAATAGNRSVSSSQGFSPFLPPLAPAAVADHLDLAVNQQEEDDDDESDDHDKKFPATDAASNRSKKKRTRGGGGGGEPKTPDAKKKKSKKKTRKRGGGEDHLKPSVSRTKKRQQRSDKSTSAAPDNEEKAETGGDGDDDDDADRRPYNAENFVQKLHRMVTDQEAQGKFDVVQFFDGGGFWLYAPEKIPELMPHYNFRGTKFSGFRRQLTSYGFKRERKYGPGKGAYKNPLFVRGRPELCDKIARDNRYDYAQRFNSNNKKDGENSSEDSKDENEDDDGDLPSSDSSSPGGSSGRSTGVD